MMSALVSALDQDPQMVDRLRAAGVLHEDAGSLRTTVSWQDDMLRAFQMRGTRPLQVLLQDSLLLRFPTADASEIGQMARIMLAVEAREAGCSS